MLCLLNSAFWCFISFNVDTSPLLLYISPSIFFFHFGWFGFLSLLFPFVFILSDSLTLEAVAYRHKMVDVCETQFSKLVFYLVDGLVWLCLLFQ